ncbi:hypothetical protein PAPYR_9717 [Paratrimastix pyriformis]|uniref:Uncharacterized protein n=1 Tax=Paratrimastix pyriformis TaxID=342808 RepID=A0ABQ8UBB1_9EUKA|nr:hypothetical protein PAPYR_9717 [Paratrimastix pyriformis]
MQPRPPRFSTAPSPPPHATSTSPSSHCPPFPTGDFIEDFTADKISKIALNACELLMNGGGVREDIIPGASEKLWADRRFLPLHLDDATMAADWSEGDLQRPPPGPPAASMHGRHGARHRVRPGELQGACVPPDGQVTPRCLRMQAISCCRPNPHHPLTCAGQDRATGF